MKRAWQLGMIALAFACVADVARAQTPPKAPPRAPKEGEVASDPIRCWWKTDRTAIRVGERFTLVLTCAVIETSGITVVPAVNQLEPGAISLTPFEAVSGIRRDDVVVPPWRYLQFEYTMRLLSEGFFGQDVNIPSLTVTYNLQAPGGENQGRDQTYMLPPLPMRVLSLVPRTVSDIRDASGQTFAAVESRRFWATAALVAAGIAFAFAAVLAVLALAFTAGRIRGRDPKAVRPLPAPVLLRACLRRLRDVQAEARGGWTPELAGRALAALRIAASLALGRAVAQQFVDRDAPERQGQVAVRSGWLRRKRVLLSAPTTSHVIATRLENGHVRGAQLRANLEQLGDALQALSAATYGRAEADSLTLNGALDQAVAAIRRLRVGSLWPMRTAQAARRYVLGT